MLRFLRPRAVPPMPSVPEIAVAVAARQMYLVDVRERGELLQTGTARGARHIPLSQIGLRADPQAADAAIRPGMPVVVFCASGGRSGAAARRLRRMGYAPVWNLGGFGDWVRAGGQVERV
ncbi:MAG: sulfurtransferase [Rhodobacteraceae bacterium]|jgi:rhodanese-related sulfurtransferase|nr:sulfurtransferase [Paracoccaceae bacterium]